jgi:RNA polymerase sigma factor (sigma-70 family)
MTRFSTTRWSVVIGAQGGGDSARASLESLCRTYRPPVVAYIASRGYRGDAEDLAQAFFARFLEGRYHAGLDPARGRFRSYLLTAIQHFLISADVESKAVKRGRGIRFEDIAAAGETFEPLAATGPSPEEAFDQAWALAVLDAALARLGAEAQAAGKGRLFDLVRDFMAEAPEADDYARVAAELGLRTNTVAVAVHRLRQRLRELVREEVAETAADNAALADELEQLRSALGAP